MTDARTFSDTAEPAGPAPARLRVLLIEDEGVVAMLLEDMIADLGHEVSAVASQLPEALRLASAGAFDAAILDVNLHGQPSYAVADLLAARGIPFVFATGYGTPGLAAEYRHVPTLQKPFMTRELERVLRHLVPQSAAGA